MRSQRHDLLVERDVHFLLQKTYRGQCDEPS
jgi:hypothetical protein